MNPPLITKTESIKDKRVDLTEKNIKELTGLTSGIVTTAESVLIEHGTDRSAHPQVKPSAVVTVNTTQDVSNVLSYCNHEGIPVVAYGVGTSLEGHILPIYGGISLDMANMNKIIETREQDLVVRVQAGLTRMELNEALNPKGYFFSVDPGANATIGGMAAAGAAGSTTVRYGSMTENVMAMTAVLADGSVINVGRETRKLSAGYDLSSLLVGSEGTLAVITELSLRIFGLPEKMASAVVRFPSVAKGMAAAATVVRRGVPVARCEFLDAQSIKNVNAYDNLQLTESPTIFFEFHGSAIGVAEDAERVKKIVGEFGGSEFEWTLDETERKKLWQARHNAYYAAAEANPGMRTISTDAAVPLSRLADAVAIADAELSTAGYPFSILGHAGDGNFHCSIMTNPENPNELAEIQEVVHKINTQIIEMGGTCTGEHGIGIGKIRDLELEAGVNSIAVMRAIKNALDPKNILNPGKIFSC